jgi:hypothetical protein
MEFNNKISVLVCMFCGNVFYCKKEEVFVEPFFFTVSNKPCPLCDGILQIFGLHAESWNGKSSLTLEGRDPS